MSGFLDRVVARALGTAPVVHRRREPVFAVTARAADVLFDEASEFDDVQMPAQTAQRANPDDARSLRLDVDVEIEPGSIGVRPAAELERGAKQRPASPREADGLHDLAASPDRRDASFVAAPRRTQEAHPASGPPAMDNGIDGMDGMDEGPIRSRPTVKAAPGVHDRNAAGGTEPAANDDTAAASLPGRAEHDFGVAEPVAELATARTDFAARFDPIQSSMPVDENVPDGVRPRPAGRDLRGHPDVPGDWNRRDGNQRGLQPDARAAGDDLTIDISIGRIEIARPAPAPVPAGPAAPRSTLDDYLRVRAKVRGQ
jgi:hypothetical protein